MCQEQPGPRCFSDSCKTSTSLNRKLASANNELDSLKVTLTESAKSGDFIAFRRASKRKDLLTARVNELETKSAWNQRDIDGTKTGRRQLEKELSVAASQAERLALAARIRKADSLRFAREHALACKRAGRVPALRFNSKAS